MNCYVHADKEAIGTCVGCGKFICAECNTEIKGRNYCKKCVAELLNEKNQQIEKEQNKNQNQPPNPMVFMNAGGGVASSSSSSSSSGVSRRRYIPNRPRQSMILHMILLFSTMGVGNAVYFLYIKSKQNQWDRMYR
jgi:hypothetical protein